MRHLYNGYSSEESINVRRKNYFTDRDGYPNANAFDDFSSRINTDDYRLICINIDLRRITTVEVQRQQIIEMKPKASYYDVVLNCPDLISISVIAKDYGKSAKWLNSYLHSKGIQYKQGSRIWLLYQKYAQLGYTSTKTHSYPDNKGKIHTSVHTYWTQAGRLFIYATLKADNILPLIERI